MAAIRRSRVIERLERRQKRVSMRKENVEPVHQDLDSGFSSDEDDLDEEMLQRRSEQRGLFYCFFPLLSGEQKELTQS